MTDRFPPQTLGSGAANDTIFAPKFDITPAMAANLENIDRSAWLIQNMLIMPKHEAWIKRQVRVRRAAATTRIEGATLNDEEVDELSRRGAGGRATEDELANLNALSAYEFIDYVSDERDIELDELVVRQLNREFLKGLNDKLTEGRYRTGQNTVGPFTPPDAGAVPDLMRSFGLWLKAGASDELSPVLRAGIAHIHLVAVHPFWDGNGRVARGVATLILQRSTFHFKKLLSLEAFIAERRHEYFSAIERTLGVTFNPGYDATPWLEWFVQAVMAHGVQLQTELTDWHRSVEQVYAALQGSNISHRQTEGIIFALRMGRLTRSDYTEIAGVSDVTASRDLRSLVAGGWLVPHGEGRGRYYTPDVSGGQKLPEE
ncbi:MAG: Fic family protein [Dehalococcoidia bacterium]